MSNNSNAKTLTQLLELDPVHLGAEGSELEGPNIVYSTNERVASADKALVPYKVWGDEFISWCERTVDSDEDCRRYLPTLPDGYCINAFSTDEPAKFVSLGVSLPWEVRENWPFLQIPIAIQLLRQSANGWEQLSLPTQEEMLYKHFSHNRFTNPEVVLYGEILPRYIEQLLKERFLPPYLMQSTFFDDEDVNEFKVWNEGLNFGRQVLGFSRYTPSYRDLNRLCYVKGSRVSDSLIREGYLYSDRNVGYFTFADVLVFNHSLFQLDLPDY